MGDAFPARRDVGAEKSAVPVLVGRAQVARWLPVARQFAVETELARWAALCTPAADRSAEQSCAASAPRVAELWPAERSWLELMPAEALLAPEAARRARLESAVSHWPPQSGAELA